MNSEKPLVYTSKGNVLAEDLEYRTEWEDSTEYTKFTEQYLLDGEVVKSSCHVYTRKPLELSGEQASF